MAAACTFGGGRARPPWTCRRKHSSHFDRRRCSAAPPAAVIEGCEAAGITRILFGELPKTSTGKVQKFQLREHIKSASAIE
jgi:hypothetical protein